MVLLLAVGGGVWLWAQGLPQGAFRGPQPSIGEFAATPDIIALDEPTAVVFTVNLDTPTLNPASVELLRVDENGTVLANLGRMWDNGTSGDVRPGDKTFSREVLLNEPSSGSTRFQVSAAFRGLSRRTLSQVILVETWIPIADDTLRISLLYPPGLHLFESLEQPDHLIIQSASVDLVLGGAEPEDGRPFTTSGFLIGLSRAEPIAISNVDAWVNSRYADPLVDRRIKFHIRDVEAYQFTFRDEIGAGRPTVVIPLSNRSIIASYSSSFPLGSPDDTHGLDVFWRLLQTIRFQ